MTNASCGMPSRSRTAAFAGADGQYRPVSMPLAITHSRLPKLRPACTCRALSEQYTMLLGLTQDTAALMLKVSRAFHDAVAGSVVWCMPHTTGAERKAPSVEARRFPWYIQPWMRTGLSDWDCEMNDAIFKAPQPERLIPALTTGTPSDSSS